MNEYGNRRYSSLLGMALMARSEFGYHLTDPGKCVLSGEDASQRAIAQNDHKKLSTRKQRMKEAMRKAALGEKA